MTPHNVFLHFSPSLADLFMKLAVKCIKVHRLPPAVCRRAKVIKAIWVHYNKHFTDRPLNKSRVFAANSLE